MEAHIVEDGQVRRTRDPQAVQRALAAGQTLWVDLEARTAETETLLADVFHIHPVAAEDIWIDRVVPKVEAFPTYLHVLLFGVLAGDAGAAATRWSQNLVLGPTWLLTLRSHNASPPPAMDRCEALLREGPSHVVHAFLDDVVDGHVTFIEGVGKRIEALAVEAFRDQGRSPGRTVFDLRRALRIHARLVRRQLDALTSLYRDRFAVLPAETTPYIRDAYDHFIRVADLTEDDQEEVQNIIDGLLAVQSTRTNDIMKTLTMVSTMLLPLSFIASVFGMNFHYLPGTDSQYGFYGAVALMVAAGVGFAVWFRHKRWT